MKFSERVNLAARYEIWLQVKNRKQTFRIANTPVTFLAFLESKGLLKEISPDCALMNAREECEDYIRQSNYTCDLSDLCASCKYNKNIQEVNHDINN